MTQNDIIAIVGAGPAGLIAAETLARVGLKVAVYERKPTPARKFLMAGRGGLNLTHTEDAPKFLQKYGEAAPRLQPLIKDFTPDDLRQWCHSLGEETFVGSSGRVFPKSFKASPLLRAWLARLTELGVVFHYSHEWRGFDECGNLRFTAGGADITVSPKATLLALGGASWPGLGSDGVWTEYISALGVEISPLRPSNCGFLCSWSAFMKEHAGKPLKAIALSHAGRSVRGEVMIDSGGIEGGAVYALSASIRDTLASESKAVVTIDLRPDAAEDFLVKKLSAPRGKQSFSSFLRKALSLSPLEIALLREVDAGVAALDAPELARLLKNVPVTVTATSGLARAISSAGGVVWDALDSNLMLCQKPGVFVAGEMIDWEAPTGGYLLQGCFASGVGAGNGILRWLSQKP